MTLDELDKYTFSYVTQNAVLLFKDEPTLQAIHDIRRVLDIVTDSLIQQRLKG